MEFITNRVAVILAKVTLFLIIVAVSYYILKKLAQVLRPYAGLKQLVLTVQKLIPFSRKIHIYASVLAGTAATIHALFFLMIYPLLGIKIYSGIATLLLLVIVSSLGVALWRSRSNLQLRYQHRNMVVIFITALLIHSLMLFA